MYLKLRNFVTVHPDATSLVSKYARNDKEKTHETTRQDLRALRTYREKCRGGGAGAAPPPPPPPGLIRVKAYLCPYMINFDCVEFSERHSEEVNNEDPEPSFFISSIFFIA